MAYLRIRPPHAKSTRLEVRPGAILGRALEADIWVADDRLSRLHCRLEREGDHWVVADLNSRNGTYVGGERVERHVLRDGDEFDIGDTRVTFYDRPLTDRPKDPIAAGLVDSGSRPAITAAPSVDPGESLSGTRFASHATPHRARRNPSDSTLTGGLAPTAFRRPPATPQVGPATVAAPVPPRRRLSVGLVLAVTAIGATVLGAWLYFLLWPTRPQ